MIYHHVSDKAPYLKNITKITCDNNDEKYLITCTSEESDPRIAVYTFTKKDIIQCISGTGIAVIVLNQERCYLINKYAITANTKDSFYKHLNKDDIVIGYIIVPSVEISMSLWDVHFFTRREIEIESNTHITTEESTVSEILFNRYLPTFKIEMDDTVYRDGYVEGVIKVFWKETLFTHPINIYIESDSGYINKRKLTVSSGIGRFICAPLYLGKDDTITIKFGYKHRTNVSRKIITVL